MTSNDLPKDDTHAYKCNAGAVTTQRIKDILRRFEFFQAMGSGLQDKLAAITSNAVYPSGTVLFQQGDPPGNCYVILEGEVGIFHKKSLCERSESMDFEEGPDLPNSPMGNSPTGLSFSRKEKKSSDSVGTIFHETIEGFSSYHVGTDFGRIVNRMGRGQLLGELALIYDSNRAATAKCLGEVECLIIERLQFDHIFKEALTQVDEKKLAFLQEHVPGMKDVPCVRGKPLAAHNFRQATFSKGHAFLKQGTRTEDSVYVVTKGAVQVCFSESTASRYRIYKLSVLLPGGFFGSLPTPSVLEPSVLEPFTVVALRGPVEVFYADTEAVHRMPKRLLDSMREYLAQTTVWHHEKLQQRQELAAIPVKRPSILPLRPKPIASSKHEKLVPMQQSLPRSLSDSSTMRNKCHTNSEGRLPLVQLRSSSKPRPVRWAWD